MKNWNMKLMAKDEKSKINDWISHGIHKIRDINLRMERNQSYSRVQRPIIVSGGTLRTLRGNALRADYEATGSTPVISNEYWIVPQIRHQYDSLGRKVPAFYRCEVFHEDNYRGTLDVSCRSYNDLLEQSNNKNREIREAV